MKYVLIVECSEKNCPEKARFNNCLSCVKDSCKPTDKKHRIVKINPKKR